MLQTGEVNVKSSVPLQQKKAVLSEGVQIKQAHLPPRLPTADSGIRNKKRVNSFCFSHNTKPLIQLSNEDQIKRLTDLLKQKEHQMERLKSEMMGWYISEPKLSSVLSTGCITSSVPIDPRQNAKKIMPAKQAEEVKQEDIFPVHHEKPKSPAEEIATTPEMISKKGCGPAVLQEEDLYKIADNIDCLDSNCEKDDEQEGASSKNGNDDVCNYGVSPLISINSKGGLIGN